MHIKQNSLFKKQAAFSLLGLLLAIACPTSFGQSSSNQLNYWLPPQAQAQAAPKFVPAPQYQRGYLPQFTPDFWNGKWGGAANGASGANMPTYLNIGTVFTGVLTEKLSSRSSKPGDVFAILLPDGYVENGQVMIPQGSKIVGSVVNAQSAHLQRNSIPGNLSVSLQTLVLPDSTSVPIYGFIERNPNMEVKDKKGKKGPSGNDYKQAAISPFIALTNMVTRRGTGMALYTPGHTGFEFTMDKGEVVAVRLNRPLDVTKILAQQTPTAPNAAPNQITSGPGCHCSSGLSAQALKDLGVPGLVPEEGTGTSTTTPKF